MVDERDWFKEKEKKKKERKRKTWEMCEGNQNMLPQNMPLI